jgi:hypothetical protein
LHHELGRTTEGNPTEIKSAVGTNATTYSCWQTSFNFVKNENACSLHNAGVDCSHGCTVLSALALDSAVLGLAPLGLRCGAVVFSFRLGVYTRGMLLGFMMVVGFHGGGGVS